MRSTRRPLCGVRADADRALCRHRGLGLSAALAAADLALRLARTMFRGCWPGRCWDLSVLALGAWRAGFKAIEILTLLLAPATISCLVIGQTSNLFLGLLLVALSTRDGGRLDRRRGGRASDPEAAARLCPAGDLPAAPAMVCDRRGQSSSRWSSPRSAPRSSASTSGAATSVTASPSSARGERSNTGPFMLLEPSVFMAGRILTGDAGLAFTRPRGRRGRGCRLCAVAAGRRAHGRSAGALALAATALITPYFHTYDGGLLLCAALLAARQWEAAGGLPRLLGYFVVIGAWVLPDADADPQRGGAANRPHHPDRGVAAGR